MKTKQRILNDGPEQAKKLYDLVYAMRTFQQLYFKTRDKNVMMRSIEVEKQVDELLEEIEE